MHLRNNSSRYGALALAAHWMTALLVLASWLLGTCGDLCREVRLVKLAS